jgi:hypothetical protein
MEKCLNSLKNLLPFQKILQAEIIITDCLTNFESFLSNDLPSTEITQIESILIPLMYINDEALSLQFSRTVLKKNFVFF